MYPSYKRVQAQKRCYPDTIEIVDDHAEVSLQCLLNHTASRLIQFLSNQYLELIVKWGFDLDSRGTNKTRLLLWKFQIRIFLRYGSFHCNLDVSQSENTSILWINPRPFR